MKLNFFKYFSSSPHILNSLIKYKILTFKFFSFKTSMNFLLCEMFTTSLILHLPLYFPEYAF